MAKKPTSKAPKIQLYKDRLAVLEKLEDVQAGKLFKAIYYFCTDKNEELEALLRDGLTDILFVGFKAELKASLEKYERRCITNSINGTIGNEIRWGNKYRKCDNESQNIANAINESQNIANTNQTNTNNTNNKIIEDTKDISSKDDSSTVVDSSIDYDFIVDYWNKKTKGTMGALRVLGPNRKKMVRARIKEYGQAAFLEMIDNAAASKFMHGTTWASFEWCIRPNNFPKVLENKYEEKNNNGKENSKRRGSDVTATQASDYEGEF